MVFGLPQNPLADVWWFTGNATVQSSDWVAWKKPKNRSMISIFLVSNGGGGGNGVIGASSSAGGGGGGGSSGQTIVTMPLALLPETLWLSIAIGTNGTGFRSQVAVSPFGNSEETIASASGGTQGGNASGGTQGSGGGGGAAAVVSAMYLGFAFAQVLAGQTGTNGGTAGNATALTLPATGIHVTGGMGGAGCGGSGTAGAGVTLPTPPTLFPNHIGGAAPANSTSPPGNGSSGYQVTQLGAYFYGGTGGGSTHGSATGGGLVQSSGGNGGYGCGGGGMGGALTGSSAGVKSFGGNGLCIITCW